MEVVQLLIEKGAGVNISSNVRSITVGLLREGGREGGRDGGTEGRGGRDEYICACEHVCMRVCACVCARVNVCMHAYVRVVVWPSG